MLPIFERNRARQVFMERKDFILKCGQWCVSAVVGGSLLQACSTTYYATNTMNGNILSFSKKEFQEVRKDGQTRQRKFVLLRSLRLNYPICVFALGDDRYSALLMVCTHNACELNPTGDYLICPCHGSEFNNTGKVQNPPAEIDLQSFKVTHDENNIHVHL